MKRLIHLALSAILLLTVLTAGTPALANDCLTVVEGPGCQYGLPADLYQSLLAQMNANPTPAVTQVGVDAVELRRYSFSQIDRTGVTIYDSPSGTPLETVDPGYAFVIPESQTEGWVEIEPGKWVSRSNLSGTRASSLSGVMFGGPLPFPMGWILEGTRPSQVPGGRALKSTPIVYQHTRVYIYYTVHVGDWDWYLVGPGQWVNQRGVGRVNLIAPPGVGGRWVAVDLYEQVLTAYQDGTPVFATPISSGLRQWPTREGLFQVWAKMRTDSMNGAMGKPDQYSIPVVPYVMYFDGDKALHGAFWHNGFGYRHSHGCVNMSVSDARWLYEWLDVGAPVYVYSSR